MIDAAAPATIDAVAANAKPAAICAGVGDETGAGQRAYCRSRIAQPL
jgi:hypothetical protein